MTILFRARRAPVFRFYAPIAIYLEQKKETGDKVQRYKAAVET